MNTGRRILILYAHPSRDASRVNRALRAAVEDLPGVTLHDLYETYPDFLIDVRREQELLLAHEVLVLQHPMYWYSAPAIVKEWQDAVLESGWAYGEGGTRLAGKPFLQAVSAGGQADSYRHGGTANFTLPELLRPFEQMAHYTGMIHLAPFLTSEARLIDAAAITAQAARYRALIETLRDGALPPAFDTIPGAS